MPAVEVIAPPQATYSPKPPPAAPAESGQPMTSRQMAEWLSRYIAWGGEMTADREALRRFVEGMAETKALSIP